MTKREIADTFRRMRRSSGLTQQELADRLGKKQQTVGHWETGYAQPDIGTLLELFGVYQWLTFGLIFEGGLFCSLTMLG